MIYVPFWFLWFAAFIVALYTPSPISFPLYHCTSSWPPSSHHTSNAILYTPLFASVAFALTVNSLSVSFGVAVISSITGPTVSKSVAKTFSSVFEIFSIQSDAYATTT